VAGGTFVDGAYHPSRRRFAGISGRHEGQYQRFTRLARLASEAAGGDDALVAVLDEGAISVLGCHGAAPETLGLDDARIRALPQSGTRVIADTSAVAGDDAAALERIGIRRYAGFRLQASDGRSLGGLIEYGSEPGPFDERSQRLLAGIGALVGDELATIGDSISEVAEWQGARRYRALTGSRSEAVFTVDQQSRITSGNTALARLTGKEPGQLKGQLLANLVVEEDQSSVRQGLDAALAGEAQSLRLRLRGGHGNAYNVAVTITPVGVGEDHRELVVVGRDISETVAAEQRLDLALESSGQGIWEWDADTGRVYRSHHLRRVVEADTSADWVDEETWLQCLHPSDRDSFRALIDQEPGAVDRPEQGQWRLDCGAQGYRWFQWHARVFSHFGDGRPARVVGAVADIHDLKLAEDRRLREAGRMALAVRAGGAGSFELGLDNRSLDYDARMHELIGLTENDEPVGIQGFIKQFHFDDQTSLGEDLAALAQGQTTLDREHRIIDVRGVVRHLRLLAQRMEGADGSPLLVGTCWDVTDARAMEEQLAFQARHDALTGLANRYEFERHLAQLQDEVDAGKDQVAVGFIDLDRFKIVNDTAGHGAGDELLRQLGASLARSIRGSDMLARLGGDEFGLVVRHCTIADAHRRLEGLIDGLKGWQFQTEDRVFEVSASGGIAALEPGGTVATAMSHADVACYAAKVRRRGSVAIYEADEGDTGQHHRELELAAGIRAALTEDRFRLYGQLIEPCHSGLEDSGGFIELLVRMVDSDGDLVRPDLFIPAAEHYDLMVAVDRWIVNNSLLGAWQDFAVREGVRLSINLSGQSINDPGFLEFVLDIIDQSRIPPDRINFEITETAVMTHMGNARVVVDELRQRGCAVALDDFGSGLSSFNYLRHFNVDFVKIDGGFVREMVNSEPDRIIVQSINDLAHRLGAQTIAEFVTDEAVFDTVRAIRVDYAQGYAIGRPEPLASYYSVWPGDEDAADNADEPG